MHDALLAQLKQFPIPRRYVVALSGGCDSVVLLHALQQIRPQLDCQELVVVHIDHGLQSASGDWATQCRQICDQYALSLTVIELQLVIPKGESLEAIARHARYAAFQQFLQPKDMLLLAHHQNDQAETLLLQMLRGSGVSGLAGMPAITESDNVWLTRPLLNLSRDDIESYAHQHQLTWIEDPSNQDTRFDRNFLRHEVVPTVKKRWPAAVETLSRVAQHQADAKQLLTDLAEQDWQVCKTVDPQQISVNGLKQLSVPRVRNVLRYWLKEVCQVALPDTVKLQRIIDEVLCAAVDAEPQVSWENIQLRRYRDILYLEPSHQDFTDWQTDWDLHTPLRLPSGETLSSRTVKDGGLLLGSPQTPVRVKYRQGGERCRLPGRTHHHDLKKLFQSWGVPPWQRARIPLIYIGSDLAQIVGYSVCEPFIAKAGQSGIEIYVHA